VELDKEIDLVPHSLAHLLRILNDVLHLLTVRLEIYFIIPLIKKWVNVAEGCETRLHLPLTLF
jgi:hypothetical protein